MTFRGNIHVQLENQLVEYRNNNYNETDGYSCVNILIYSYYGVHTTNVATEKMMMIIIEYLVRFGVRVPSWCHTTVGDKFITEILASD
jgi:hypothetical protein